MAGCTRGGVAPAAEALVPDAGALGGVCVNTVGGVIVARPVVPGGVSSRGPVKDGGLP